MIVYYSIQTNIDINVLCYRYGIGAIYSKQERFQLAEIHFKRALSINQHNPVLMCHIGVVSTLFFMPILVMPRYIFKKIPIYVFLIISQKW